MRRKNEELRLDVARRIARLERLAGIDTDSVTQTELSKDEVLRRLGRLQAQTDMYEHRRKKAPKKD